MSSVLYLLVGLPYSGKSTLMQKLMNGPVVNLDNIRIALHDQRFVKEAESFVWAIAQTMVGSLFLAGHLIVYLDATNTTVERRSIWISDKWNTIAVTMGASVSGCVARAEASKDEEIIPIITRMAEKFEKVSINEGFCEIISEDELLKRR